MRQVTLPKLALLVTATGCLAGCVSNPPSVMENDLPWAVEIDVKGEKAAPRPCADSQNSFPIPSGSSLAFPYCHFDGIKNVTLYASDRPACSVDMNSFFSHVEMVRPNSVFNTKANMEVIALSKVACTAEQK